MYKYYAQFTGTNIDDQIESLKNKYSRADINIIDIVYTHTSTDTIKTETVHDGYAGGTGASKFKKVSRNEVENNYSALITYEADRGMKELVDKEIQEELDWEEYKRNIRIYDFVKLCNKLFQKSDAKSCKRSNELKSILKEYGYVYDFKSHTMIYGEE